MSSIKDVAKAAGVSVTTVSNILNKKIFVSEELHQRVIKAMEEMDYHPNFLATNLRSNKVSLIGVIISALDGHYHQIIDGIYRVCKLKKCQPILKIVNSSNEEQKEIELLLQLSVRGIIVVSSYLNEDLIKQYGRTRLPVVFVDHYPMGSDHNIVRFNNEQLIYDLTLQLMQRNKTVGLITGSRFLGSEEDCVRGYLNALDDRILVRPILFETDFNKERAFTGLFDFIRSLKQIPDCLIVSAAHLAKTVSEICNLLNIRNTSIYSLSGDSWYKYRESGITYVCRDAISCGVRSAELLFENMEKPAIFDTCQITLETHGEVPALFEGRESSMADIPRQKSLKCLLLKSNISDVIEKLSKDFTLRSGIEVSITACSQQDLAYVISENARKHSDEYDIIMADMHWMQQLCREHVFYKLNDLLPLDEIMPRYIRDVRRYILSEEENVFALPILAGHQMLVYRRDLFENELLQKKFYLKHGIELRPPLSWNEFNLIASFFTKENTPESPVEFGTCLLGSKPDGIIAEFLPRQWSYRGKLLGEKGIDIVTTANQKAIKNLCESYRYSYPDCMNFLEDEQIEEFTKGNIAMISTYNVHLYNKLDVLDQKYHFAKLPGASALVGGWMLGINAYSKKVEESAQFMSWEMSDQISVHSSLLGQISPFKKVFYDRELLTIYPWMSIINEKSVELRSKELGTLSVSDDCMGRQLELALSDKLWMAIKGEATPKDLLMEIQQQFSK